MVSQDDPSCLVAEGRGFTITRADVDALRRAYTPALEPALATRLATDVWLAEWIATGAIAQAPLRDRIAMQQRLAATHGTEWSARLREAALELELRHGPCYVPRA